VSSAGSHTQPLRLNQSMHNHDVKVIKSACSHYSSRSNSDAQVLQKQALSKHDKCCNQKCSMEMHE